MRRTKLKCNSKFWSTSRVIMALRVNKQSNSSQFAPSLLGLSFPQWQHRDTFNVSSPLIVYTKRNTNRWSNLYGQCVCVCVKINKLYWWKLVHYGGDCYELPQSLQMSSKIQRTRDECRNSAVLVTIGRNHVTLCNKFEQQIKSRKNTDKRASKMRINYGRRQRITRSILLPHRV